MDEIKMDKLDVNEYLSCNRKELRIYYVEKKKKKNHSEQK